MRIPAALAILLLAGAAPPPAYTLTGTLPLGAPDRWGYVKADPERPRVYAAHGDRITVIDTDSMTIKGQISVGGAAHGTAVLPRTGRGYAAGGLANKVFVFDLQTLETVATIDTAEDPDEMVAEPMANRVWVIADGGARVQRVDAATNTVTATIEMGDKLESAVADGHGRLFVDSATRHEVVVIDTERAAITARWPVPDCASLHGIDYDAVSKRIFASCTNGHLHAIDSSDGRIVQTLPIGLGGDVVTVVPRTRRVMASNADGALSVFALAEDGHLTAEPNVPTRAGARTMALERGTDGKETGRILVVAAQRTDAEPTITRSGGPRYTYKPETVELLVFSPFQ